MHGNEEISRTVRRIKELLNEIKLSYSYKKAIEHQLDEIDKNYQLRRFGFVKYRELTGKVLGGKTREEVFEYYDSYIYMLLKQADQLNSLIFDYYYSQNVERIHLNVVEKPKRFAVGEVEKEKKAKEGAKTTTEEKKKLLIEPERELERKRTAGKITEEIPSPEITTPIPVTRHIPVPKPKEIPVAERLKILEKRRAEEGKPAEERGIEKKEKLERAEEKTRRKKFKKEKTVFGDFLEKLLSVFRPKPGIGKFAEEKAAEKEREETKKRREKTFLRFEAPEEEKKKKAVKEERRLPIFVKRKEEFEGLEIEAESKVTPYYLAQEAKRIKKIIKKEKEITAYEPSSVGAIANMAVRRIGIFLVEKFPDTFKEFYYSLRRANIKLLSNTYLNIMIFFTILAFIVLFSLFAVWYYLLGQPLIIFVFRSFVLAFLLSVVVYAGFYYYPLQIIKNRRRSVNTNLPFAINHMAAMIGAGVPPSAMFRMISESEEYEEISVELRKIVELTDYFGYDLVTAVKSVSTSSPSPSLKEFFDGFVSAVETGGDLKMYLRQKSDESMLAYKLEREKYVETISTYSDIYTGVLIAAPLFFVVTLSLVSILGGTIGGFNVNTLMAVGTYALVPLLNIGFIIFLEITQPEI